MGKDESPYMDVSSGGKLAQLDRKRRRSSRTSEKVSGSAKNKRPAF